MVKGQHCSALCHEAITSVTAEDGVTTLYELDKIYDDTHVATFDDKLSEVWLTWQPWYLYKLRDGLTAY